ncbi:unnamed protein product [Prorocentrum cordatum]|uniref:Uncharacterized protein n=1 Tax=Prorocentrum cordatum TaxID=2364126 RepID=A0ABN9XSS1_9DINO|nr:unnamed protein product [Polarella glacialis]
MSLPRGPLTAAAAVAVHVAVALGLWSSTPTPTCPQPVCPAPFCLALVCPDCVSAAGAPDPGPPGGSAALGLGEVPEELAEIRSAAVRLEEQLALLQTALEDDTYRHERVALAEVRSGVWIIVTPDGDRYSENIRCRRGTSGAVQAVHLVPGAELLDPMKGHFYKFRAALDASELVEQIKLAEGESFGITRRRRPAPEAIALWDGQDVEYQALMDSDGTQLVPLVVDDGRAAPGAAPGAAALPRAAPAGPPPDVTWLIIDPVHPDFGRERHPSPDAEMAGECAMALDVNRRPVPVKRVPISDVASFRDMVHMRVRKILDDEAAAAKADGGLEGRLNDALDGGTKTPPAGEDARTLTVSYDEHGGRHKDWRSVCAEISYSHFGDWEKYHEGPPVTLPLFKNIQRQGGDPRLFFPIWCRDSGVSPQERAGIEMKLLLEILYLSGCYDQVNGPSLASVEAVSRRVCQIIEAYSAGIPGRANWEGAKHFMPLANAASVAPPELRSHAHRRAKEEVEIENMRLKARGLQPAAGVEGSQPTLPGPGGGGRGGGPRGDPKGGGRGGGPKGGAGAEAGKAQAPGRWSGPAPVVVEPTLEESLPPITPYWGPVLSRSRRKFLRLMRALLRVGLVTLLPAGSSREQVGMFFVKKMGKSKPGGIVWVESLAFEIRSFFEIAEGFGATVSEWETQDVSEVGRILERGPWKYFDEGIFTLEARALLLGFQALVSEYQVRNARVLFLVDNMGVCLSFARGRTTDFRALMPTLLRRLPPGDTLVAKLEQAPKGHNAPALDELNDEEASNVVEESDATSDAVQVRTRPVRRTRALAAPRLKRARQPVEASRLQGLGLLPLESSAAQSKTEIQYHEAVYAWRARAREFGEPLGVAAEVDASVARQLQELFDQGENLSKGEKLVAGLGHFLPEFGRHGGLHLSRCHRALKGWRRRCPPRSRRPLAFSIWAAIIWELCRANFWNMGVYALFMLVTYMRPSEPLKLLKEDLLAPAHGLSASWICFAFRQERGVASKTYATDESIDLSCKWVPYLSSAVAALRVGGPKSKFFNFTHSSYTHQFKIACKKLGLTAAPYQARHSGASIDAAMKYRTRAEIKSRGRWKADKSVLRYDSKAKIVESVDKLTGSLASHVHRCELQLGALLRGQIDPSATAPPAIQSSRGIRARLWDKSISDSLDLTVLKNIKLLCSEAKSNKLVAFVQKFAMRLQVKHRQALEIVDAFSDVVFQDIKDNGAALIPNICAIVKGLRKPRSAIDKAEARGMSGGGPPHHRFKKSYLKVVVKVSACRKHEKILDDNSWSPLANLPVLGPPPSPEAAPAAAAPND